VSAFEKWLKRKYKDYSFKKWNKNYGKRLVGKYDGGTWHNDRIVLIHHFSEEKPKIEDFAKFLKDSEKFYDQYEGNYEIDGCYLVTYGDYDKKAFNLLRRKIDEDLRRLVRIKVLEDKIYVSKGGVVGPKGVIRPTTPTPSIGRKKNVFIVHGRDKTPALELARIIERRYPIDAILMDEKPHRGRTLIEKLEDYSKVDFAFITITPDDLGALKGEPLKERGRQNVIFELGQFIGKIGRKRTCLLIKGNIEIPSDLHGVGYYRFHKGIKERFLEIESELKEAKLI